MPLPVVKTSQKTSIFKTSVPVFSLGEKQYFIHDEDELALIFDLLSLSPHAFTLHRHVIMTLDEDLMKIIITYKGLLLCMKKMKYRNRFLLLIKVGDTLSHIIGKTEHLGSILASIPEEADKIRIIKSIRIKGFVNIIHTPEDLGNILEWVFGKGQKIIFDMLGKKFLQSLFIYGTDIYKVFHFLSDKNKDTLADILTLSFIKERVYTAEDFFYVLKALSNKRAEKFILSFPPSEIRKIVQKKDVLHTFLPKITEEKENALLQHLKTSSCSTNLSS